MFPVFSDFIPELQYLQLCFLKVHFPPLVEFMEDLSAKYKTHLHGFSGVVHYHVY